MTNTVPTNDTTPSQPEGGQPPADKQRKTHRNDRIIALLRALSRADKIKRNDLIEQRNAARDLTRAYSEENSLHEAVSSNESLITVPDEEPDTSPQAEQARSFLSSLSPKSAKTWFKNVFGKRYREFGDSSKDECIIQRSKKHAAKRRAEISVTPGAVLPPGFNRHHHILFASNVYMPLHLFTNKNLRILNREGATLATTKISTSTAKGKENSVKILDLTKFETLHGSEESLSQAQWSEAVRNYIRFFDSLDQESLSQCWEDHFGFFEEQEDLVENFNAILILDIKMRKDYVAQPFSFSMQYYALELEKMIRDTQVQRLEDLLKGGKSGAPSSFVSSTKRQRLPSSTPAGQSFQPGTHGDPSTAVCVI
ncbi:hypothetical protein M378DRAFT_155280 [Amanita muscaria Koide BX008]|uniref:Uncharacterized protein n=1 Tax=Amanita muscaria (strain Koide BX008) TaxID=946122 RepID=A0A0C2XR31_AMAMK|nr:hypothetical protein M378DRAFT_155280 [Amanita muscaria Koide BX008]